MTETQPQDAAAEEELTLAQRRKLAERDPETLGLFFESYFDRVYGYVRRLVGNEQLAEDLTQDIFVHLHGALEKYDPERELRPWVFTIATNKVRDFWRSRRHRDSQREHSVEREDEDEPGFEPAAEVLLPEEVLGRAESAALLREAVEELPEGLRMTVLLRIYEGLSFEAIGEILDRNEVAVRKRYSRALEALRRALLRRLPEEA